jgi:hypothetical protein
MPAITARPAAKTLARVFLFCHSPTEWMSKRIPIVGSKYGDKGWFALVDDEDYVWLSQYRWNANVRKGQTYAYRWVERVGDKLILRSMHREIMGAVPGQVVDHRNRNGLDNRLENLRFCTNGQNAANGKKHRNGITSRFKGVAWDHDRDRWRAKIRVNGKTIHLGRFTDEVSAATAYDVGARKYFGEFARLNFPPLLAVA